MQLAEVHIFNSNVFPLGMQEGQFFSSPSKKCCEDYYPFGLVMPGRSNNTSNPNDNYKFTGHELDKEAGLNIIHMNARGMDPVLGRMMQIDPLSDLFPGWTPYHYTHNNPINMIDPTGMSAEAIAVKKDGKGGVIIESGDKFADVLRYFDYDWNKASLIWEDATRVGYVNSDGSLFYEVHISHSNLLYVDLLLSNNPIDMAMPGKLVAGKAASSFFY